MNLVSPKQPYEGGFGPIRFVARRVLTLFAVLSLVGAPVTHALTHAGSDADRGAPDDPTACLVCRIVASNPSLDVEPPSAEAAISPAVAFVEIEVPREPPFQSDAHPTDFARGPPALIGFPVAPTGRLRPI